MSTLNSESYVKSGFFTTELQLSTSSRIFTHALFCIFTAVTADCTSLFFTLLINVGVVLSSLFLAFCLFQLYGEYREQLGNVARREATRLLTERQRKRHAGNAKATRRGHGRAHHASLDVGPMTPGLSPSSSIKKPRPYSKCQGEWLKKTHSGYLKITCTVLKCR